MNAERLLTHYEKIADTPDAVAHLRSFVLHLAVRGKLVAQDVDDEPSADLLKKIATEKARLIKAGKFQEPRTFVRINRDDLPFVPAAHWGWARLIDIARPSYGYAFPSSQFNSTKTGVPLIRIRDISHTDTEAYFDGDFDSAYLVRAGDYLVGMDGDFNLRQWQGKDGLLNQRVMRINGWRCGVNPEYAKLPLQFVLKHLHGETSLTTVKHLSAKQVNGIELPLPPIAEQDRIVAKVDELMALCDRLEVARQTREASRDKLTAASLARLNAPEPKTFKADARFALDALLALTTRSDQIKALRQTVLNLAVRGKLVPQESHDEPASELLKRVAKLKAQLGQRKKSPGKVNTEQKQFDAPSGWAWTQMGEAFSIRTGFAFKSSSYADKGTLIFRVTNFDRDGAFDLSDAVFFPTRNIDKKFSRYLLEANEILMVMVGATVGKTTIVTEEILPALLNQNMWRIRSFGSLMASRFEYILIKATNQNIQGLTQSTHGHFAMSDYEKREICIPPLAEQHRIVAKVDELMGLCDQLEASLSAASNVRNHLLQALLAEALAPAVERELAAAE
jgi:type I restriction enzyme S subunit